METYYAVHWTHGIAMFVGFDIGVAVTSIAHFRLFMKLKKTLEG